MSASTERGRVDGRAERSRRTRAAIVSANMDLLREGELVPTAERIADRAGISVRSLWLHFTDKEALLEATSEQVFIELGRQMVPIDPALGLTQRIDLLVSERVAYLEVLEPFARASQLREASSPTLRRYHWMHVQRGADEIAAVFAAELAPLDREARSDLLAALTTVTTWQSWTTLRDRLGLGRQRARGILVMAVGALLSGAAVQPAPDTAASVPDGSGTSTITPVDHPSPPHQPSPPDAHTPTP